MSTGPPAKQAKVSNINNNNNDNSSSSSSSNNDQSSDDDSNDYDEEYVNYFDRTPTNLSMEQNTVPNNALYKQLAEQSVKQQALLREQAVLAEMKKELELQESKCTKLIYKIQKERLQINKQIDQKNNEMLQRQIKNGMIKFNTVLPTCLDDNTSDEQCDTNRESVAPLSTSHPSLPILPTSDDSISDSIGANLKEIEEQDESN